MTKTADEWSDARLDDLAAALEPVPARVAVLGATVEQLTRLSTELAPVPVQLAVLAAAVDRLTEENRGLREDLTTTQGQLLQIALVLVTALLGAAAAIVAALV